MRNKLVVVTLILATMCVVGRSQQQNPPEAPLAVRAGVNGVGSPKCIYCPAPVYSDEARKADYQGTVLLDVTVIKDGHVVNPVLVKGPNPELEKDSLAQVKNWKMRPAIGPSGKPVVCRVQIEVTFHLGSKP